MPGPVVHHLPALIFMIIITQLPFIVTLGHLVHELERLLPGRDRLQRAGQLPSGLHRREHRSAIVVTVILTVSVVLISLVLGLLGLLLDRQFGRGIVRTMMITPVPHRPGGRRAALEARALQPGVRPFNGVLRGRQPVRAERPQPDWISRPLWAIIAALVWQWTPFMMLILLAGLQSRPLDVVEAAKIDGASSWQIFWNMTFPHLRQYIELSALLGSIYVVQNFDAVFVITAGGLGTANLPYIIYQTFYTAHEYGRASAAGVIVVIATIIATFALRTVSTLFREETR